MIYNTKNILVVDDSSTARLHICSILESMGFTTRQAPNGKAALELITEEKPDMIVLDLLMPEMDGTATLKVLKASKLAIPVIIISADIQEDVKEECFNLGASAFINKPFKPQVLIDTVNKNI